MESHSRVTHTAQINNLEAKKASIVQLEAVFATIGTVEAEVAKIQTLVNGNLTSENIHSLHLTSASVTVENGFIKNAMIENLDVSKALVVLEDDNKNAELSARNIADVKTAKTNTINVYDILKYNTVITTKAVVAKIEEVYA